MVFDDVFMLQQIATVEGQNSMLTRQGGADANTITRLEMEVSQYSAKVKALEKEQVSFSAYVISASASHSEQDKQRQQQ